ncbi:MAG: L-glutamate gamma-semialdehyde dehydrogenase [Actinobacteria bacterium]|nr:L-glutamate gamma-semialdehyde dehydrogenase [Actinomycetota bacterium]MBU1942072.1 L-glutamate gamma-semialdehyde dehydrogenase [Actinomycetota bacterium]MBU2688065.1 L-glutamate gamma-semialdehyde dehydrogenase [Actinomycetota bacterium]
MFNGIFHIPEPENECVLDYAPGSKERAELQACLQDMIDNPIEVPAIIGGREVESGDLVEMRPPHDLGSTLGRYHRAGPREAEMAIDAANEAKVDWSEVVWSSRATVLLKAAELLAGKYRQTVNAATMLCMSKTCHQAEIDSACELIDFWRFNPYFMTEVYDDQPMSVKGVLNYMEHRPLEGFVFAITPFNFTSIAGNLPTAPALMGNAVIWKPASTAVLPAYYVMKVLEEAGMPDGVINMVPGPGPVIGPPVLNHLDLGGVHFTGSTYVFSTIWLTIGSDIRKYYSYPRIVGETGGKDFIFAHASADVDVLVAAVVRGAFEFQGQKCSAPSRVYVPDSIWPKVKEQLLEEIATVKMGDITDFSNFMGAVIDKASFDNISEYLEFAKSDPNHEILCGGGCDSSEGYYVEPTVVQSTDPRSKMMCEEIFGPVITVFVYPVKEFEQTLQVCNTTSPYALTGAIFAQDRFAIGTAVKTLRHAAGNFYINDKPTGAVVGQQPFGGSRASGTNDKAGSWLNLERWVSPRAIKETFLPPTDYRYPFLGED